MDSHPRNDRKVKLVLAIVTLSATICPLILRRHGGLDNLVLVCYVAALILAVLEGFWPKGSIRPLAVKVAAQATVAAALALFSAELWQIWNRSSALPTTPVSAMRSSLVSASLQITPSRGQRGEILEVAVTGAALRAGSSIRFGPGINVLDSHYASGKTIAHLQILADSPAGFRRVWISNSGKASVIDDSPSGAFQVTAMEGVSR